MRYKTLLICLQWTYSFWCYQDTKPSLMYPAITTPAIIVHVLKSCVCVSTSGGWGDRSSSGGPRGSPGSGSRQQHPEQMHSTSAAHRHQHGLRTLLRWAGTSRPSYSHALLINPHNAFGSVLSCKRYMLISIHANCIVFSYGTKLFKCFKTLKYKFIYLFIFQIFCIYFLRDITISLFILVILIHIEYH